MQLLRTRRTRIVAVFAILAIGLSAIAVPASAAPPDDLVLTGVIDGPLPGGLPKAVELYVINDIPDLSIYGIGSANNGGGTDGEEFTFPAVAASAGTYIYVASEAVEFANWFGFAPDYTNGAANINGDDAIELFTNGSVSDVFGDINVDGTGQPWDHLDGWAYRVDLTGPDGSTFVLANWSFSGINALDGESTNATAASPFPAATHTAGAPVDSAPSVSSTTPADTATNVAIDANITIDFSEAVDASGSWFDVSCSVSGAHTATASGGPASFTLDPDADFTNSETCTVTVFAAQVTDQDTDDPPDNMVADYVFSFTTVSAVPPVANPGDVVINEIIQNPAAVGDNSGEWLELYNATASDIDIDGWTIADNDTDSHVINNGGPLVIPAGGFLVLGNNTDSLTNGGATVNYGYGSSWFLSNGADEVVLVASDATEIDRVEYDDGATFPDPTGASMSLIDTALDNNVGANWCESTTPYGDGDLGTPGAANSCAPPPTGVNPGDVIVTEIIQNPAAVADGSGEWFEVYNTTASDIDIDGWTVSDLGSNSFTINNGGPLLVPAGGYLVLGNNADSLTNGGVTVAYDYGSSMALANGDDEVILTAPDLTEIDRVEYDGGPNFPDPTGASMALISPALDNNVGANWCEATTPYGDGDLGTPGAANDCTPPPSGGEVLLTEIVVTPTGDEFIEIHNPTGSAIDLTNVYLTDATFSGGGAFYYNIVTGANAGGGGFGDFNARFPAGASIPAGAYQTVSLSGSGGFVTTFGVAPDYELWDDASADGELLMLEALTGSINGQGGLSNGGEVVILYQWDGLSDLVTDLDYAVWGDKAEAVDKTGVSVDGPDADAIASAYAADTAIASQDILAPGAHSNGNSWQRDDLGEGTEATSGGNGLNGEDETSEDLSNTWCENAPTPGAAGNCGVVIDPPFGMCLDPATLVHDVQGNGTASPLLNTSGIIVEGIVIGDYQDTVTELAGFYIQEEDAEFDADATTSEGIFINDNGFGTDVVPGDVVRVQGTVLETFGLTQLSSITNLAVCSTGASASETTVTLPVAAVSDWEFVEGMLVTINQELSATENFTTGRFGEVALSVNGRLFNPTNVTTPGAAANALQDLNNRSRILLDDASTISNPLPLPPYLGPDNTIRLGDTLPSLTGVLTYGFSTYRMQPVGPINFTRVNDRQVTPTDVGGSLKVASFNVLNYFTTIDTGASICGPGANLGCRGADTPDEFTRQRDKIISAITTMDVDVVGLMEIENNTITAIQNLVDGLNAVAGAGTYSFIDTGTIGTDAIRVAIIYKPAKVSPIGAYAVLDSSVDPLFIDTRNRPALAQTFEEVATGAQFTVVVNHLKSKGSACTDLGDPDAGDGQGNCNGVRTDAATALVNWLATDPTGSGDPDFLITGDLNAYAMEDPVTAIKNAGYTNLIESYQGLYAYSYTFQGQAGYLDHALSSPSLTAQVSGVTEWHINGDEPAALDYNNFNQPLLYNPDQYKASDHDPVIIGLSLEIPAVAEVSDFVVLANESAYLQYRTEVNSGDVGANNASSGPFVFYHDEVVLSYLVKMLDPTSRVLGDDVRLQYGAQAYDVYHNGLTNQGSVLGAEFTPVNLPLVSAMPDVPSFTPGTQTVIVGVNQTVTLAPGDYGKLYALRGSTVVLTGGDYTFENWIVSRNAEVVFDAASNVNIEKRLYTSRDVYIGPSTGSGLTAADIRIIATGANGDSRHLYDWPKTVFIGFRNTVVANIYAPNGLLWLYSRTDGTGAFIGQWVLVGDRVTLTHDSGW